jgi:hypothetical protein
MAGAEETQAVLQGLVARFTASRGRLPDLTGLDWAWDHGWISAPEHEAAEAQHQAHAELCAALRNELAALRLRDPEGFAHALRASESLARAVTDIEMWRAP